MSSARLASERFKRFKEARRQTMSVKIHPDLAAAMADGRERYYEVFVTTTVRPNVEQSGQLMTFGVKTNSVGLIFSAKTTTAGLNALADYDFVKLIRFAG